MMWPRSLGAQSGSRPRAAAFETRIWWSSGSAAKAILGRLWRWHTTWCPGWKAYRQLLTAWKT